MSMSSVLSAANPPEETGKNAYNSVRSRHRRYDDALPKDHTNVSIKPLMLQYWYRHKPLQSLEDAFVMRNACRYLQLLRVCAWLLVAANVAFLAYDVLRFRDHRKTMVILIVIRFCVIIPATLLMIAFTYSQRYMEHPNWLVVPCFLFGMGMVAYSVIGDDPGYGTLALMIVFCYSFTPISFFVASGLSCTLIATFVTLLFYFSDKPREELYTVVGMLLLFWVAVAFVGHNLERSLRVSFLDEVIVRRQRDQLGVEKRLSDRLLANMLPKQIAAQLKEGRHVVADEFEAVTVLFCEICDWSRVTDAVVTILNRIYSQFDRLIETNNVYKVETVGEVYMVVGGCPTRTNTHAQDCVNMALAMMRCVPTLRKECAKIVGDVGDSLNIRIGLNSGPIVAGIVGIKNPRYKLFGDTVNTASRMESTSEPGRIQISDRTFPYVEGLFKLIPRGPIPVKGKGMMSTYFVDKTSPPVVMSGIVTSGDHSHMPTHRIRDDSASGRALDAGAETKQDASGDSHARQLSTTPDSVEFWQGNGAAAAQAARELFAPAPGLGDKQHLVDIFRRHDGSDFDANGSQDGNDIQDAEGFDDGTGVTTNPTPLGGGPNDSRRIPSFTINKTATHAPETDLHLEDFESRAFSVTHGDAKSTPDRTQSKRSQGTSSQNGYSERSFKPSTLVNVMAPSDRSLAKGGVAIPANTLGLTQAGRRPSDVGISGLSSLVQVARSIPREAGRALCLYRPSDTRVGSMEEFYQREYFVVWRNFMRVSCVLCVLALAAFAVVDVLKFDRDDDRERRRHDLIVTIRYAVLVPIMVLFLVATYWKKFNGPPKQSYYLVQSLSTLMLLVVGAASIATSVVGEEPGFGVLAAYIVFCFNITLIAYAFRAIALLLLIAAHIVCIATVSDIRGFELLEQLGYLCVFYLGQGLPVLGREYYNRENYIRREKLGVQKKQLKLETERTDRLLENLLPREIARQLKDGAKCIAGHFEMATILFTDMRGFTNFSSNISPGQLVGFLNVMYSKFDMIATKYGIHKVEIIGDAYFSVAGCPATMPDHAERCAAAALEMLEYMPELRRLANADIRMRVGIHTGPLVAGVVGVKDPRYHLFGNTVNLAMAMESNGIPSKVHISSETYSWLERRFDHAKRHPEIHDKLRSIAGDVFFAYTPREPMEILGRPMQTYILERYPKEDNIPGANLTSPASSYRAEH